MVVLHFLTKTKSVRPLQAQLRRSKPICGEVHVLILKRLREWKQRTSASDRPVISLTLRDLWRSSAAFSNFVRYEGNKSIN
jgi:hypothetical protein